MTICDIPHPVVIQFRLKSSSTVSIIISKETQCNFKSWNQMSIWGRTYFFNILFKVFKLHAWTDVTSWSSLTRDEKNLEKNLVSVSESTSEIEIFYLSESASESMSELMSELLSVSASEPLSESNQVQSGRSQAVIVDGRAIVDDPSKSGRSRAWDLFRNIPWLKHLRWCFWNHSYHQEESNQFWYLV